MTRAFDRWPTVAAVACLCLVAYPTAALCSSPEGNLAASCASCHRPDGDTIGIPSIANLDESRIVRLMLDYRSGERADQIMQVVARALSLKEIVALAHYIAGRPSVTQR